MVRLADRPQAGPDLRQEREERNRPRGHLRARFELHAVRGRSSRPFPCILPRGPEGR